MKSYFYYAIAIGFAVSLFFFMLTGGWEFLLVGPVITLFALALHYIVKSPMNRNIREEESRKNLN